MNFTRVPKRILLGTPMRSDRLGDTLLPKRIALPIFASSSLSTVAYAPQEILLVLALGGTSYLTHGPWVGLAVVALIVVMVLSYRQTIRAYPSGGGDYEVAASNLGRSAGSSSPRACSWGTSSRWRSRWPPDWTTSVRRSRGSLNTRSGPPFSPSRSWHC